jgi:hypothetical protein
MTAQGKRGALAWVIAAATVWLAAGCATMSVSSYARAAVDARSLRTYEWGSPDTWSTGDPRLDNNRFFDERVRARVDEQLAQRGFEKSASGPADLLVHYHASVSQEIDLRQHDRTTADRADHEYEPFIYDKGTLVIDVFDRRTGTLIWRGWAEGSIDGVIDNQRLMESRIDEAVAKILARLPQGLQGS